MKVLGKGGVRPLSFADGTRLVNKLTRIIDTSLNSPMCFESCIHFFRPYRQLQSSMIALSNLHPRLFYKPHRFPKERLDLGDDFFLYQPTQQSQHMTLDEMVVWRAFAESRMRSKSVKRRVASMAKFDKAFTGQVDKWATLYLPSGTELRSSWSGDGNGEACKCGRMAQVSHTHYLPRSRSICLTFFTPPGRRVQSICNGRSPVLRRQTQLEDGIRHDATHRCRGGERPRSLLRE